MKKIIFNIFLCLFIPCIINAQSDNVTFLPGLGESETVWSGMSAELQQQYVYYDRYEGYYGYNAIDIATNSLYIPTGDVVVAHSQGGLLAREYLDDRNPGNFKALVTVGTPHQGAPIVTSTLNGTVSTVFRNWVRYLALGFYTYYSSGQAFQSQIIDFLVVNGLIEGGKFALEEFVIDRYRNQPGVNDMIPGSSFLSQLNDQPDNTLPSARYAIYGAENYQTPWHLMGSLVAGPGNIEDDVGIEAHRTLLSFYAYVTNISYGTATAFKYLMERAEENYNFQDYIKYKELYQKWIQITHAFYVGYDSLYYGQQYQWSKYVTGSLTPLEWHSEDGILSKETQAPAFFDKPGSIERRLPALGANHIEETAHPSVRERLEQAFGNPDVNISDGGEVDSPLSVSISGVSQVNDGQSATFTADVSDAEGSVSYQWYYKRESYGGYVLDGSSPTYEHTFHVDTGDEIDHSAVKVEISSAGETATDVHSVYVSGCQGGLAPNSHSQSIGIQRIALPPCD